MKPASSEQRNSQAAAYAERFRRQQVDALVERYLARFEGEARA